MPDKKKDPEDKARKYFPSLVRELELATTELNENNQQLDKLIESLEQLTSTSADQP